ncbi:MULTISPECIES: glycosyltransferase [unclassified Novosphingobium]|uniref:glycosyltransferase n=1 Tax=unclassified Novosphingobium TaxID=2644732 RepID=UPI00146DDAE8|nr:MULTISPECIES: glycosyltransferase [unclassified Novosphingobium]NMN03577.1 glycosyltransferase involved in cell wall biosynthesis [Novosphingobium sp. SG919]NMN86433.1 glycosyltransferase involved in cell wall biosynthesis [Novosphingobium sp. SG916]
MRVLTFLHSFEPGGVERVALRLHRAWLAQGIDARLVLGRTQGAMRGEWPGLEAEVFDSHGVPTAAWETLWMMLRLPGAIRRHRPDVLFCAGNSYTVVAVVMRLVLGKRCPPILAKISNDLTRADLPAPARPFYRLWLRIQGRMLHRVVGMAQPMRAELQDLMGVPADRVAIIDDPALDEAQIAHLETLPRPPRPAAAGRRFLAIGRLAAQKNFPLLLRAFARIARPTDRLTILGEGGARKTLQTLARSLDVADRVDMPGHVNPVSDALLAADALVMSSDYEGVPAVVPEALAAGLPVVSTDCSVSMADLLGHGRFGLLVPVRDEAALAAAMDGIAALPFDSAAARTQARRFTVEIAAQSYVVEMQRLAHG